MGDMREREDANGSDRRIMKADVGKVILSSATGGTAMGAEVEEQRVMMPGRGSWMEWRAVCYDHVRKPEDDFLAPWMAHDTHANWIDAQLDAIEHNIEEHHDRMPQKTWDEIIRGDGLPEVEPLLPNGRLRPHHAQ